MKILAVVPARGGSKEILRKNLKEIGGKPLIYWTLNAALKVKEINEIIVSTDDEEIAQVAKTLGINVPFYRPAELAQDRTSGVDVALHAIEHFKGFDWLLYLQPTSLFRTSDDIRGIINFSLENRTSSCVSVCRTNKHPHWMYNILNDKTLAPFLGRHEMINNRQELPECYVLNGALYLVKISWLKEKRKFIDKDTFAYLMPEERSLDIDTMLDWNYAEFLFGKEFI